LCARKRIHFNKCFVMPMPRTSPLERLDKLELAVFIAFRPLGKAIKSTAMGG